MPAAHMRAVRSRPASARSGRLTRAGEKGPKRATVLVIDDDQAVRETFARMLTLEGYDVRAAVDAEHGLREAQDFKPQAIIVDLRMPLVDGVTFLRRLREFTAQHDTPVAIVTGDYFLDDAVAHELEELGAELRFKPLWLEDLVQLAGALLTPTAA